MEFVFLKSKSHYTVPLTGRGQDREPADGGVLGLRHEEQLHRGPDECPQGRHVSFHPHPSSLPIFTSRFGLVWSKVESSGSILIMQCLHFIFCYIQNMQL